MSDKVVHRWSARGRDYEVSLFGVLTPPTADPVLVAQELARLAVENVVLREALAAARLESPNVELHAALTAVRENAPDLDPAIELRAKNALERHKPRPMPEPVVIAVPEPVVETLTPAAVNARIETAGAAPR